MQQLSILSSLCYILLILISILYSVSSDKSCYPRRLWDDLIDDLGEIRNTPDVVDYIKMLIFKQQHPLSKSDCSIKRLLILDSVSVSFEGIGSVMKQVNKC